MLQPIRKTSFAALMLALTCTLGAGSALAEKPDGGGKGHGKHHDDGKKDKKHKEGKKDKSDRQEQRDARVGGYFSDRDRQVAQGYYGDRIRSGKSCPPGLAKKNNGCLPPGQAKKYAVGQPLPAGVVLYSVPQPVLVQLPPAPSGHKYVRVAADILLIAVGSSMVIDAIADLGRL